jgi:hypothetical protein
MSKFEKVSICIDDLYHASKAQHPAITKHKNGKKYASVVIWFNDEPDKFGNDISLQLSPPKDVQAEKVYLGNGRTYKPETAASVKPAAAEPMVLGDDLPF